LIQPPVLLFTPVKSCDCSNAKRYNAYQSLKVRNYKAVPTAIKNGEGWRRCHSPNKSKCSLIVPSIIHISIELLYLPIPADYGCVSNQVFVGTLKLTKPELFNSLPKED
jgi:hypothetical protein